MITRLVEDWLTNANERLFELPFCHLLQGEGYNVVHLTRHGELEQGKDILALDPQGIPCAFQLKGTDRSGRIRLTDWEKFKPQIDRLVELPIVHPSIPSNVQHRAILVTNGHLDEAVRLEIVDRNRAAPGRGYPLLETVTKGDFLSRLAGLQTDFWPSDPTDLNLLLEFFLSDGRGVLKPDKFWRLVIGTLPFEEDHLSVQRFHRTLASAGIFCSYALAPYARCDNHIAVIEGWGLFVAACMSLAEKFRIPRSEWEPYVSTTLVAIDSSFVQLYKDALDHPHFCEGDATSDVLYPILHQARTTWVLSMLACWDMWRRGRNETTANFLRPLIEDNFHRLLIVTEADIPKVLVVLWFLRKTGGSPEFDRGCSSYIDLLSRVNHPQSPGGIPDPYHSVTEVIDRMIPSLDELNSDLQQRLDSVSSGRPIAIRPTDRVEMAGGLPIRPIARAYTTETFAGRSYMIESLLLLFVRRNWRGVVRDLWPRISRLAWCQYRVDESWLYYWWDTGNRGQLMVEMPTPTMSWELLRRRAADNVPVSLPQLAREHPEYLLLFVLIAPFRLTPEAAIFLDSWITSLPHGVLDESAPFPFVEVDPRTRASARDNPSE